MIDKGELIYGNSITKIFRLPKIDYVGNYN